MGIANLVSGARPGGKALDAVDIGSPSAICSLSGSWKENRV